MEGWFGGKGARAGKRKMYIEVDDDSNNESGPLLLVDKGKAGIYVDMWMSHLQAKVRQRMTGVREHQHQHPLASKQPCLSGQPDVAEDGSPAVNQSDRPKFLSGLSQDSSYKELVDALMALPDFVCMFYFLFTLWPLVT